jgi:hypothetical protein
MPKAVTAGDLGAAKFNREPRVGFALDLADRTQLGNWDIKGRVTAVEAGKFDFITEKGEAGRLFFRLPEGFQKLLASGEPVSIKRRLAGNRAAMGYDLVVSSAGRLVLGAGRLLGDSAGRVRILDGLVIEQGSEPGKLLARSKYEDTYLVPVALVASGRTIQLTPQEPLEVFAGGKAYRVMIQQSSRVVPSRAYEGVTEGSGYVLEYIAAPK